MQPGPSARGIVRRRPAAAGLLSLALLVGARPVASEPSLPRMPVANELVTLIAFVRTTGWRVDLRTLCEKIGVAELTPACVFKQIAVEEANGRFFPHGVNVPLTDTGEVPYVLFHHLNPVLGTFLVVSPRAEPIAIYVRSQGTDYQRADADFGKRTFDSEMTFWNANLDRVKALPKLEREIR